MEALLGAGARRDLVTNFGSTALHAASQAGSVDVARVLLREGCSVDAKNNISLTPLCFSCRHGRLAVAQLLVEAG